MIIYIKKKKKSGTPLYGGPKLLHGSIKKKKKKKRHTHTQKQKNKTKTKTKQKTKQKKN